MTEIASKPAYFESDLGDDAEIENGMYIYLMCTRSTPDDKYRQFQETGTNTYSALCL